MPPDPIVTIVAIFGAVAALTGGVTWAILARATPERRRLERTTRVVASTGVLLDHPALTPEPTKFVKQMNTIVPRSPKERNALERRMIRAGLQPTAVPIAIYSLTQIILPIICASAPFFFWPPATAWLIGLIAGIVAVLVPSLILDQLVAKRQKVIRNGLPDALDLLIVCLEAGSSMDQAILKVSDELAIAYPALAEELRMVVTETRAGKPRLEAFRGLATRTGVDDVRALVAMLVQTDRFGTSVAQALRTHADVSRTKRRQEAEERAAKIGVKMVFPLVFCLFPAFFVVTLGPAVVKFVRIMLGQVLGQ
jgi:tight adherence protein C